MLSYSLSGWDGIVPVPIAVILVPLVASIGTEIPRGRSNACEGYRLR